MVAERSRQRIGIVGLGQPGLGIVEAALRRGDEVLACDFKRVSVRTLARVYGTQDVGAFKAHAAARLGRELPEVGGRIEPVVGRIEEAVGGATLRGGVHTLYLAADRPSCTKRVTEMLLRVVTSAQPVRVITVNVGEDAAQVRAFRFPVGPDACPLCGTGAAYFAAAHRDLAWPCDGPAEEAGDAFTIPFDLAEGFAASALALAAARGPAGMDLTLALTMPPQLYVSQLTQDPECRLECGRVEPWPAESVTVPHDLALLEAVRGVVMAYGFDASRVALELLRPVALGAECQCGRRPGLTMLRAACEACGMPTVPVRGWTQTLALKDLAGDPEATPASMGLPAPELMLVSDRDGRRVTISTEAVAAD